MTAHFESYQLARFVLTRDGNTAERHALVRDNHQGILKLQLEFQLDFQLSLSSISVKLDNAQVSPGEKYSA